MKGTYRIETLGCKVNQYETTAIEEILREAGYGKHEGEDSASVCIINTCTVTHTGDKKSRQWISRFRRENPEALVVVMGCYAQVAHDQLAERPDVDLIVGTKDKEKLPQLLEEARRSAQAVDAVSTLDAKTEFAPLDIQSAHERTRATLKVQDGCNQYCSYCIIPYARGPVRSRDFESIREELARMAELGYKEVVLTGIHLASYGKDLAENQLVDVIRLAEETEGIERIRLSSLEPGIVTDDFVREISEFTKLCDHFHLSMQSGSDTVLARMKRRYTTEEYAQSIARLRSAYPNAGITTDVICGFPGETESEWQETMDFVRRIGFSTLHVFAYSPREGTPAAKMADQVRSDVKKARSAELTALGKQLAREFLERQVGRPLSVLLEENEGDGWTGHSKNYCQVRVQGEFHENQILEVIPQRVEGDELFG